MSENSEDNFSMFEVEGKKSANYINSDPKCRVVNRFYEGLLPLVVEEWHEKENAVESEPSADHKLSGSSLITLYTQSVHVKFKNGCSYYGQASGKRLHGQGVLRWPDGSSYKGTFYKNQIQGFGDFTYSNGARYSGQVSLGHRHGKGTYITETFSYSGSFFNSLFHGQGRLESKSRQFNGDFMKNKMTSGTFVYDYGIFVGTFDDFGNRKKGQVLFNNNDSYQGHWHMDEFCDFGVYKWSIPTKDTNKFLAFNPFGCTGYWSEGKRNGLGKLEFDDRTIFCSWNKDMKEGPGMIVAANGEIFASENMFCRDDFQNSRKVVDLDGAHQLVQQLLHYFNPFGSDEAAICSAVPASEHFPLSKDIFKIQIRELMAFTLESQSGLMPFFLPNYTFDFCVSPIKTFIQETLLINDSENCVNFEVKCVNQAVVSILDIMQDVYRDYATFGLDTDRKDVVMTRLGLWQFYRDIFASRSGVDICDLIAEVDLVQHTFSRDPEDAKEIVKFWQFLRHVLYIVMFINKDSYTRLLSLKDHLPFFGKFATMFLVFWREFQNTEKFVCRRTVAMIRNRYDALKRLNEKIKEFESSFTIRSIFRFYKNVLADNQRDISESPYKTVQYLDFLETISEIFPQMIIDGEFVEMSFRVTPLEFAEAILGYLEKVSFRKKYSAEFDSKISKFEQV